MVISRTGSKKWSTVLFYHYHISVNMWIFRTGSKTWSTVLFYLPHLYHISVNMVISRTGSKKWSTVLFYLPHLYYIIVNMWIFRTVVKEGFGNKINLSRDRGLNHGSPEHKSDTLILDHQLLADFGQVRGGAQRIREKKRDIEGSVTGCVVLRDRQMFQRKRQLIDSPTVPPVRHLLRP
uniref:Uncharacterized protein n=1 Tax=Timema tahoe TaxID=61484 RepID=A0A7R9IN07_9NEOP|nr:unnamed protein product [Timema tahoe]